MGTHRPGGRDQVGGRSLTTPAARVVPNVPTFSVDGGFWYRIPEHLEVTVGSQVRVPLSGRRVRGWVVEVGTRPPAKLKDIAGVSGEAPVFDTAMLRSLEWASIHYVAPLAVVLSKATPPNLPRRIPKAPVHEVPESAAHPIRVVAEASARGKRHPAIALVGPWRRLEWLAALGTALGAGRNVAVITATAAEAEEVSGKAMELFGDRVVLVPTEDDKAITDAWMAAQRPGSLVVGPPRLACWRMGDVGLVVVLEEGRRVMKDRQTPTIHVREMVRTRARAEGFNAVFFGPTPSVETLAAGATVVKATRRAWAPVEIVDRSGEPPGEGLLAERVVGALRRLGREAGDRAFILANRKLVDQVVDELNRRLGRGAAAPQPGGVIASVGTERDLATLDPVRLTVASTIDFMPGAAGYRGEEEAIRVLARLGNAVLSGGRMMAQTSDASSPLADALRRGDPIPYLERVLAERARQGMPPAREMLAVEVRGEHDPRVEEEIGRLEAVDVFGPAEIEEGRRWLLAGRLDRARPRLRELAGIWRERGITVRIDADPIDF
ncbi:MAG: hypothetical protein J5I28_09465 [Acidimicrobiales bacterium]|nr:hypothetical protein [Acidimicrobiales bacterium]HLV90820.1 hypothetical protein [Acidimicrobiia bacterium]